MSEQPLNLPSLYFLRFLRLRLYTKLVRRGAFLWIWDPNTAKLKLRWFQMDESMENLQWFEETQTHQITYSIPLNSIQKLIPAQLKGGDDEELHYLTLICGQKYKQLNESEMKDLHILFPDWKHFHVWYNTIAFLAAEEDSEQYEDSSS